MPSRPAHDLSFDDIYKDWLALNWPYPTICEAAGNGADAEFVNHKGYNRLTVANHNDAASGMAGDTVFRNPSTGHGDRELPEIAANGIAVTAVGLTLAARAWPLLPWPAHGLHPGGQRHAQVLARRLSGHSACRREAQPGMAVPGGVI